MAFEPVNFFAASDIVVVGANPEMADYDNPRGELFGVTSYVVAEDADGERVRTPVKTVDHVSREAEALAPAEKMAAALRARYLTLGKLPVGFASWTYTFPAYGSAAYQAEEASGELAAWERATDEV